jgi:hypothetical protein
MPRILRATLSGEPGDVRSAIDWIRAHMHATGDEVHTFLAAQVPEYRPAS